MPGRNDPCPCGSGKKYKKCCAMSKAPGQSASHVVDLNTAIVSFEKGNYPAAAVAAKSYLHTNHNDPMAWQVLGVSQYYLSEFKGAEKAFRNVTKLDKQNYIKNEILPTEYNDAHAALRGYANSKLNSSKFCTIK